MTPDERIDRLEKRMARMEAHLRSMTELFGDVIRQLGELSEVLLDDLEDDDDDLG